MSGDRRDRGDRLAEALRENLRRRKAQARVRREPGPGDGAEPAGAPGTGDEGQGEVAEDGPRE